MLVPSLAAREERRSRAVIIMTHHEYYSRIVSWRFLMPRSLPLILHCGDQALSLRTTIHAAEPHMIWMPKPHPPGRAGRQRRAWLWRSRRDRRRITEGLIIVKKAIHALRASNRSRPASSSDEAGVQARRGSSSCPARRRENAGHLSSLGRVILLVAPLSGLTWRTSGGRRSCFSGPVPPSTS